MLQAAILTRWGLIWYNIAMPISPEQSEYNPKIIEVDVEPDSEKECPACGNLFASESMGCSECRGNEIKMQWQAEHHGKSNEKETRH